MQYKKSNNLISKVKPLSVAIATVLFIGSAFPVYSQNVENTRRGSTASILEEVVVTARKRKESLQDAPLSVSALGSLQIEALKIRDLTNLAVGMPNVALDEVGTTKGTANFSIRGLGVNSSIPSIDPTVGVFVDGVYMGVNNGIIFDTFDVESIEVLRGPQGILFGRNVTGGAVLINTKKPGEEFSAKIRTSVEGGKQGGLNKYLMGSVAGPVSETVGAKLTVYYNDDDGGFENQFNGKDFGEIEQTMIRPVLVWNPNDDVELVLRYEYTETTGQGAASQSHTSGSGIAGTPSNFSRDSFGFSIDEEGFQDTETHFLATELNWSVGDNGTITNIFGWRDFESFGRSDIDAQPIPLFHADIDLQAEQFSNETRYNTVIADKTNFTAGIYYFNNDISYGEGRDLLGVLTPTGSPALTQDGGGLYEVTTLAAFVSADYDLTENLILTGGVRYTKEEKEIQVASLSRNVNAPCKVLDGSCEYDFADGDDWTSVSPKLGMIYLIDDDTRLYGHWTRGFRSGGYNLRNTSQDPINFGPGPFDEEQVDSYEFGMKKEFSRGRVNGAIFYTKVKDMQREVNLADPNSGIVQVIKNTADAEIMGLELDGVFSLSDNMALTASFGWLDAEYSSVSFDLNSDGVIDNKDKGLDLPRAAKLTYSVGLTHDLELGDWGYMTSRINYGYRDDSAFTDNNLGFIAEQKIADAGLDFYSSDGRWTFSLYGKNLLDEVKHGGDTQLPAKLGPVSLGGTFSPLSKGRVIGTEISYAL